MTDPTRSRGRYPALDGSNVSVLPGVKPDDIDTTSEHEKKSTELMPKMTVQQKKVWLRLGPHLVSTGRLSELSVDAFQEYCDIKTQLDELKKFRKDKGYSYETEGRHGLQHKAYPEMAQLNQLRTQFTQLCAHFGLTPATEARIRESKGSGEQNPFAK